MPSMSGQEGRGWRCSSVLGVSGCMRCIPFVSLEGTASIADECRRVLVAGFSIPLVKYALRKGRGATKIRKITRKINRNFLPGWYPYGMIVWMIGISALSSYVSAGAGGGLR